MKSNTADKLTAPILPSSVSVMSRRSKQGKDVWGNDITYILCYCANCGCEGNWYPEASLADGTGWVAWLCTPCGEKWAPIFGYSVCPDEVFWEKCKQEMLDREGRELTGPEIIELIKDPNHYLNVLARDRPKRSGV